MKMFSALLSCCHYSFFIIFKHGFCFSKKKETFQVWKSMRLMLNIRFSFFETLPLSYVVGFHQKGLYRPSDMLCKRKYVTYRKLDFFFFKLACLELPAQIDRKNRGITGLRLDRAPNIPSALSHYVLTTLHTFPVHSHPFVSNEQNLNIRSLLQQ